jgi:hypothetical protein
MKPLHRIVAFLLIAGMQPVCAAEILTEDGVLIAVSQAEHFEVRDSSGLLKAARVFEGEVVKEGRWTPDDQYYVFQTTFTGDRLAWHRPVYFYSRQANRVYALEDFIHGKVSSQEVTLAPPDVVVMVLNGNDRAFTTVKLSALISR